MDKNYAIETLCNVIEQGQYYSSALDRYGDVPHVVCDFCKKTIITMFIGLDEIDLCLDCCDVFKKIFINVYYN